MRILIVEDDEVLADSLIRAMVGVGYATDHAGDGERALSMLLDGCYDLVILDINLPRLDGFAVCRALKQDPATRHIRVLAMTGYPTAANIERIMDAGAEVCLEKPIDTVRLLELMQLNVANEIFTSN